MHPYKLTHFCKTHPQTTVARVYSHQWYAHSYATSSPLHLWHKKSTIHHSQTNRKVNSSTARYDKSTYRQQKAGKWYDSPGKFAEKSHRQAHARSRFFYPEQLFLAAHLLQETESSRFILYFIHYTYCCVRVDYIVYETPVCSGGNNNDGARAPIVNRFNIEKKSPR